MGKGKNFGTYELSEIGSVEELRTASELGDEIDFSTFQGENFRGTVSEIRSQRRNYQEKLSHIITIDETNTNRVFTVGMNMRNLAPYIGREDFKGGEISGAERRELIELYSEHTISANGIDFGCRVQNVLWSGPGNGDDPIIELDTGFGESTFMIRFRVYGRSTKLELLNTELSLECPFSNEEQIFRKLQEMRDIFLVTR